VVAAGITLAPTPALAEATVQITRLNNSAQSGEQLALQYRVAESNPGQQTDVQVLVQGMNCARDCDVSATVDSNGGQLFEATLTAPSVAAGQEQRVRVVITVTENRGGQNRTATADREVRVTGPARAASVQRVSGKVRDQNGKAVSGASVGMKDSAGTPFETTTNGSGGYSFNASDAQVIAPGKITVVATKQGYDPVTVDVQAAANQSVNVPLTLKLQAVATTATPSASASVETSAEPVDEATDDTDTQTAQQPAADNASSDSGSSTLFLVLGGLLVAAGVGAMVLVLMRRKNAADEDGYGNDPTALPGGAGMVPPSHGRFNDATRVGAPMGASRDPATMVTRMPGGNADAPTMMHRPVPADDEFPDPYGAPIPQQGGGYGSQYGAAGNYADQQNQYGGYADQRRYDEPTGMYQPEADQDEGYAGYGRGRGGYGAAGGAGEYGAGAYQSGGYDDGRDGYGPRSGGAYPAGGAQQYDDGRGGYAEPGGYDQRGGNYGRAGGNYGGDQRGGYDQGGYDDRGGQARQEAAQPAQRRSLDWMDD
jgi:carboxypeptidase family protein